MSFFSLFTEVSLLTSGTEEARFFTIASLYWEKKSDTASLNALAFNNTVRLTSDKKGTIQI